MLTVNFFYPSTLDMRWAILIGFIIQYSGYLYLSQSELTKNGGGVENMIIGTIIIAIGVSICFIFTANELHVVAESIVPKAD